VSERETERERETKERKKKGKRERESREKREKRKEKREKREREKSRSVTSVYINKPTDIPQSKEVSASPWRRKREEKRREAA